MRFSARQQECLEAMGIVPWVSRYAAEVDGAVETPDVAEVAEAVAAPEVAEANGAGVVPDVTEAAAVPEVAEATVAVAEVADAAFKPAVGAAAPPPDSVATLGEWISTRALVPIHYRGSEFPALGAAEASVLVIVEHAGSQPATAALEGDSARLFQLMLRSIQLTARDTRQCLLSTESVASAGLSVADAGCTPQTRAVLMLMNSWPFDITDIDVEHHVGRLPGSELPLWRIAHPQLLLEQPLLKRQAWQVLKALQSVLTGSSAL